jgi:methylmalonyl-CoA mutase C-terminal domain/subunit
VDILGISILSGAHMSLCQRIVNLLRERNALDICFVAGGFIPDEDVPDLKSMGVREVFGVRSQIDDIIAFFRRVTSNHRGTSQQDPRR